MYASLQIVQSFVAPVVMISADGLLCLAFYNRMAAIVHRTREINRERFGLAARLVAGNGAAPDAAEAAHIERRVEILDQLGHQLFERLRLIRGALLCLLASVLMMICCSLALGLSPISALIGWVALGAFVLGSLTMAGGVCLAIAELSRALEPVEFEHQMLEQEIDYQQGTEL